MDDWDEERIDRIGQNGATGEHYSVIPPTINLDKIRSSTNRLGDIAENLAAGWLMDQGYEVFKNAGCSGPADLLIWDLNSGEVTKVDVKRTTEQNGNIYYQKNTKYGFLGVVLLHYIPALNSFVWDHDVNRPVKLPVTAQEPRSPANDPVDYPDPPEAA